MPINNPWASGALLVSTLAGISLAVVILWGPESTLALENRLLENLQGVLLVLGALAHTVALTRAPPDAAILRAVQGLLVFVCLGCALREVDIDALGDKAIFEPLERLLRGVALVGLGLFLAMRGIRLGLALLQPRLMMSTPFVVLSLLGTACYLLSWPFDKDVMALEKPVSLVIEETLELWACTLLFAASLPWSGAQPSRVKPKLVPPLDGDSERFS